MKYLKGAVDEIVGLFVDDWLFAGLIILWVILFSAISSSIPEKLKGVILVLPFAALVIIFAIKKSRATKK